MRLQTEAFSYAPITLELASDAAGSVILTLSDPFLKPETEAIVLTAVAAGELADRLRAVDHVEVAYSNFAEISEMSDNDWAVYVVEGVGERIYLTLSGQGGNQLTVRLTSTEAQRLAAHLTEVN